MAIAIVYATLIMNGRKTFKEVPTVIQPKVKQVLEDCGMGELAAAE